ncbi:MAG: type IV pilus modification protein PilV [Sinimarinibacterium sp.]|jgi:type IV pilus assembly protein PilV
MSDQRGFTLIEVLVTVVILAIGLLGLANLQTVTLQRDNGSAQRVEALNSAYDLLDRMRANRSQALAGRYDVELGAIPSGSSPAETDMRTWKQALAAGLPDGDASVLVQNSVVSINVVWSDVGNAGSPVTLNLRTQL